MNLLTPIVLGLLCLIGSSVPATAAGSASSRAGSLPVIEWKSRIQIPDDVLFVDHSPYNEIKLIVSLDGEGRITSVKPISGFSLYLRATISQIQQSSFSPSKSGKEFVLTIPDPLDEYTKRGRELLHEHCTPETDLKRLYWLGVYSLRHRDRTDEPERCYEYILKRNPLSVAGRYGAAMACLSKKNFDCANKYLKELLASHPELIEARLAMAGEELSSDNYSAYVSAIREMQKSDVPLSFRLGLVEAEVFGLKRLHRFGEVLQSIQQWTDLEYEFLRIDPDQVFGGADLPAYHGALMQEASGLNQEALRTYQLARIALDNSPRQIPLLDFEVDLGLARTLRKTGNLAESQQYCKKWQKRWKKLVSRPVHHPWQLRQDGPGELEGRWQFSCGEPEKGRELILAAMKHYPDSNAPYTALAEYYYSIGEIGKAMEAEATASRLLDEWGHRLGEF